MFPEDFKYVAFPIEDVHDAEPNEHFEAAFEALSAVKENKEFALVHCTTGKNISPTIILAYMMMSSHKQDKHLPLAKAIQYVQSKAPGASPSPQFLSQLIDLEVELFEDASVKVPGKRGTAGRQGYTRGKGKRGK
jgi:protein-tyrosine phosphatase